MTDRTLTISWQDPDELAARAHGTTGLEFLRAIVAGELPPAPIQALLGFQRIGFPGDQATPEALAHDLKLLEQE